jgi:hypothetical protein
MSRLNVSMTTTVDRDKLIITLRTNRDKHAEIVKEANAGYLKAALEAARNCIDALSGGKAVSIQKYVLQVPVDYTSAYDTVINMLEWSTDEKITLQADEFRQFVQDQWDWKDGFVSSNAGYSATAYRLSNSI